MDELKKFPAVVSIKKILGIAKGTILNFDTYSGKYVSVEEEENIADDEVYYSGYAIAVDPYIVKDNIGKYFSLIESKEDDKSDSDEKTAENSTIEKDSNVSKPTVDSVQVPSVEKPADKTVKEVLKESKEKPASKTSVLVTSCNLCDCVTYTDIKVSDEEAGIKVTVMAKDEDSFIRLKCDNCGAELKLYFIEDYREQPDKESPKGESV